MFAVLLASLVGLVGCANTIHAGGQKYYADSDEVPIAMNFPSTQQAKLQAAEHWKRVADDAAAALLRSLRDSGSCSQTAGCTTLVVTRQCATTGCQPSACDTTFNRVFYNDFISALVNQGNQVSTVPLAGAVTIDFDVQPVRFSPNRPQYRYAGVPVQLGEGVWARKDVTTVVDQFASGVPQSSFNWPNWFRTEFAAGRTPSYELVITVSALSPAKAYIARNTSVYYIADSDAGNYVCPAQLKELANSTGTPSWDIPVSADCSTPRCTTCTTPQCALPAARGSK